MNLDEIKELIRVFGRSKLEELAVKDGEFEISMVKESNGATVVTPVAAPVAPTLSVEPVAAPVATDSTASTASAGGEFITSPMVGTFYASPSPDSPPFVKAGDSVSKGQVLCILEAMKIMNELEAEYDCKILEVLVKDGQPIEYDMPLFRVEKI
jgi:acetyl-CoA carboxylase biotin carboxyl carrier protein